MRSDRKIACSSCGFRIDIMRRSQAKLEHVSACVPEFILFIHEYWVVGERLKCIRLRHRKQLAGSQRKQKNEIADFMDFLKNYSGIFFENLIVHGLIVVAVPNFLDVQRRSRNSKQNLEMRELSSSEGMIFIGI